MKKLRYIFALCILGGLLSCDSFLENQLPDGELTFDEAIQTEQDLQELINSVYDVMANSFSGQAQKFAEALGEDVTMVGNTGTLLQVYNRASDFFNGEVGGFYREPYFIIFRANTVLEQVDRIEVAENSKARLRGEALAMRAIAHWELVKLFAQPYGYTADNSHDGIVLRLETISQPKPRNTVQEVYEQVIADLTEASELLPASNGIYLDRSDALAMLAKVYFLQNDFGNAESFAEDAIRESGMIIDVETDWLNQRYQQEGAPVDAMFYLVSTGPNDNRSGQFIGALGSLFGIPALRASSEILNLLTQDPNDRRIVSIDTFIDGGLEVFAYTKFNKPYFSTTYISLTELHYIAAESIAENTGQVERPRELITPIRERAGLQSIMTGNPEVFISFLREDKRKEFAGEGINVFDLKRRGALGEDIVIRDAPWNCNGMVLQFPASEITVEGFELNPEGGCN